MSSAAENNKRIAKNTLFLYFRQILTIVISLYTVRVVLEVLGAEDYGIYNVVGGVVTLFSFISNTMSSSTQRFLSYEMGKNNNGNLQKIFSISLYSYFWIIVLFLCFAETIGLWIINTKLIIPETRLFAANLVYQCSIFSFCVVLFCIPYNAAIIAMEQMNVYAYVSIIDSIIKLVIVLILPYIAVDSLKLYAILMLVAVSFVQFYYIWYCQRYFNFCKYQYCKDRKTLRDMLSFAGWNMIGALANILRGSGLNILINLFFTPTINAAYAISSQVNSAIVSFSNNFYTAVRPQIAKLYASHDIDGMLSLGYASSRYAYYLMMLMIVPLFCELETILAIWLVDIPIYTFVFVKIALLITLVEVFSVPLVNMLQASGKIKYYQMVVSVIYLMNFPISYVLLSRGFVAETVLFVSLFLVFFSMCPRLLICKYVIGLSISDYLKNVLMKIAFPTLFTSVWILLHNKILSDITFLVRIVVHIFVVLINILILGLSNEEKHVIRQISKRLCS